MKNKRIATTISVKISVSKLQETAAAPSGSDSPAAVTPTETKEPMLSFAFTVFDRV